MPWVSKSGLAKELGVSPSLITRYDQKGFFDGLKREKGKREQINLNPALKKYRESIDPNFAKGSPQIKNRGGNNGDGKTEEAGNNFNTWRTLTEQYKAEGAKLDFDIRAGKYMLKKEVQKTAFDICRQLRDDIRNIPVRCAARCAAKSKKGEKEILQILIKETDRCLKKAVKNLMKVGD